MNSTKNILILFAIVLFSQLDLMAQCKSEECVSKVTDGYTFLKTYQMDKVGDQTEYSYVFSKETNYMLMICNNDGSSQNVVVTIYDSTRKEIATNFDKKTGKYYPAIVYNCKATGIYYLKFSFPDKSDCCVSVLSFKK